MIEFKQQPAISQQTLWRYLHARFEAELLAVDVISADFSPDGWLMRFLAFCDASLAKNPIIAVGYGETGMTATLADGTYLLLHPAGTAPHERPNIAFGVGLTDPNPKPGAVAMAEYGSIKVTDPFRDGQG